MYLKVAKPNKHDKILEDIVKNPRLVGIDNPVLACQNVFLYEGKQVYGEIDFLAFDAYKGWVCGEYKSNDKAQRVKGYEQLIRNLRYMKQECVLEDAELLYIYGKSLEVTNLGKKR